MTKKDYEKTDVSFDTAVSIIRIIYYVAEVIIILVVLAAALNFRENGALVALVTGIVLGLAVHVAYCFNIGLFELIKNVRQVRNEIIASREYGASSSKTAATPSNTGWNTPTSSPRYNPKTHEYES